VLGGCRRLTALALSGQEAPIKAEYLKEFRVRLNWFGLIKKEE
jgi:hypothetical protein